MQLGAERELRVKLVKRSGVAKVWGADVHPGRVGDATRWRRPRPYGCRVGEVQMAGEARAANKLLRGDPKREPFARAVARSGGAVDPSLQLGAEDARDDDNRPRWGLGGGGGGDVHEDEEMQEEEAPAAAGQSCGGHINMAPRSEARASAVTTAGATRCGRRL